jgi:hypothetical protein
VLAAVETDAVGVDDVAAVEVDGGGLATRLLDDDLDLVVVDAEVAETAEGVRSFDQLRGGRDHRGPREAGGRTRERRRRQALELQAVGVLRAGGGDGDRTHLDGVLRTRRSARGATRWSLAVHTLLDVGTSAWNADWNVASWG